MTLIKLCGSPGLSELSMCEIATLLILLLCGSCTDIPARRRTELLHSKKNIRHMASTPTCQVNFWVRDFIRKFIIDDNKCKNFGFSIVLEYRKNRNVVLPMSAETRFSLARYEMIYVMETDLLIR